MKKLLEKLRANPIYNKYELYIPPTICVLIVIVLLVSVVVPNIFQYIETQNKINETRDKLAFFEKKETLLKSINKEQYTNAINSSFNILPNDKEAPTAIAQLYYILGLTNMSIENISFSDAGGTANGKSFKIALEIKGSLSSFTNFILQLKTAPRIMRINSLELSGNGGSADTIASLSIDAFYEPLPANISSLDQALTPPTAKDLEILTNLAATNFPTIGVDADFTGPKGKPNPFE